MIKYLGSKRRLVPTLVDLFLRSGCQSALDLFTGTTRVAQALKRSGALVTAVDTARYSEIFGRCWISLCANEIDDSDLDDALTYLSHLTPVHGYFTDTFCIESRFFQRHNGIRIDAIRDALEREFHDSVLFPVLLTSLILAADRVDSTTAVHMAYLKKWSSRSHKDLELRKPELLNGDGTTVRGNAVELAPKLGRFDFAYLDPPYNQHRYYTNYHIFETLVAWDAPEHYGVACKRVDSRDDSTKSDFNRKREMPNALQSTIQALNAEVLVLSYNNESWLTLTELIEYCSKYEHIVPLAFDSKRYVGAQIGIHSPDGVRVGEVSHLRNVEYVIVAGPRQTVQTMTQPYTGTSRDLLTSSDAGAFQRGELSLF